MEVILLGLEHIKFAIEHTADSPHQKRLQQSQQVESIRQDIKDVKTLWIWSILISMYNVLYFTVNVNVMHWLHERSVNADDSGVN